MSKMHLPSTHLTGFLKHQQGISIFRYGDKMLEKSNHESGAASAQVPQTQ